MASVSSTFLGFSIKGDVIPQSKSRYLSDNILCILQAKKKQDFSLPLEVGLDPIIAGKKGVKLNSLTVFDPHEGHLLGKINFFEFCGLFEISTLNTCGITSPALCIKIASPILMSFLFISSSLCNVALETITPPTFIGSIFATGVKAPVLPT